MKKSFPKYKNYSLEKVFKKLKAKDKKIIEDYIVFCQGNAGKTTTAKYRKVLIKICDVFGGDLDKIDLKRLREFLKLLNESDLLPCSKNEVRKTLKRFLKEYYPNWVRRFKSLKDIKGQSEINQDKINANTILRNNEIELLVRSEESLKYKAMIMLFYETAGRPEEILKLKWSDINLEKGDIKLKSSKTGNLRVNPIQNSIIHLKNYKQHYPFLNVCADDYVFPSVRDRTKRLTSSAISKHISVLGQRVLNRHIYAYMFRHSRLTELQKVLPAKVYEKFADHSTETASRYSHLDKDDIREVMFKNVYKVEEISEEKKHEFQKQIEGLINENKLLRRDLNEIREIIHFEVNKK